MLNFIKYIEIISWLFLIIYFTQTENNDSVNKTGDGIS